MNQSNLFRELTVEELENVITHHFGKVPFTYHLLKGGMFNTTYQITFSDKENYVLRIGPVNRHLLLPFEEHLMEAERSVYRLCAEQEIPAPKIVACVTDKKLIGRDYMITGYIDSLCLTSTELSGEERKEIYFQTGRMTARIHSIVGKQFGRAFDVLEGRGFDSWEKYLSSEFSKITVSLRPHKIFEQHVLERAEKIPIHYKELLNTVKKPHLVHGDLWDGNVLVTPDHKRVAAIIDADRALFGDMAYEFAGGWMSDDSFFSGYGDIDLSSSAYTLKQKIYILLYRLIDTYVYFVEYNNLEAGREAKAIVLKLLSDLSDLHSNGI